MNISAEREAQLDLTHAFYSTGLAIAVAPKSDDGLGATLKAIFTPKFGKLIMALFAILLAVGVAMWLAERRRNEAQFGGSAAHGIGAGLWWSAVTMTTVGYGDKAPVTLLGRVLGLIWMFAAIIIVRTSRRGRIGADGDCPSSISVRAICRSRSAPSIRPARAICSGAVSFKGYKDAPRPSRPPRGRSKRSSTRRRSCSTRSSTRRRGLLVLDGTFDNHGRARAQAGQPAARSGQPRCCSSSRPTTGRRCSRYLG
jgi:hypothetical protein